MTLLLEIFSCTICSRAARLLNVIDLSFAEFDLSSAEFPLGCISLKHTHARTHASIHTHAYTHVYIHYVGNTCVCVCVCECVCECVCVCVCVCVERTGSEMEVVRELDVNLVSTL
jgi:hypothetical protein